MGLIDQITEWWNGPSGTPKPPDSLPEQIRKARELLDNLNRQGWLDRSGKWTKDDRRIKETEDRLKDLEKQLQDLNNTTQPVVSLPSAGTLAGWLGTAVVAGLIALAITNPEAIPAAPALARAWAAFVGLFGAPTLAPAEPATTPGGATTLGPPPAGTGGGAVGTGPLTGNVIAKLQPPGNFSGNWSTMIGRLGFPRKVTLNQSGNQVTGTYSFEWQGRTHTGTIQGTVTGNTLTFRWTEAGRGKGEGKGEFELSSDGKGFSGYYTGEPGSEAYNPWGGKRQ